MSQGKIVVANRNSVYVHVSCEDFIAYELSDFFTFYVPNYQFTPKYKAKLWDGKIRLFNLRNNLIYRGLVPYIEDFCKKRNYDFSYETEVYDLSISLTESEQFLEKLNLPYKPRDYQVEAFIHALRKRRSLLLSPTASGKSLIIYSIMRYLQEQDKNAKGLIIVPTIQLTEQMYGDFTDYSRNDINWNTIENCHIIHQGKEKHTELPITISTWQSIYKMPPSFFTDFTYVFGDECHLFQAKSLTSIMTKLVNADYRTGTTGTLDGTKCHKLVLEGLFGPEYRVATSKKLIEDKHIADINIKCLLLKYPQSTCQAIKNYKYHDEIKFLITNVERNKFIKNLALSLKGNTLLLYQYVDGHGKYLHEIIEKALINTNRKVFLIHGGVDVDIREEVRTIVENENDAIIVASFGTFSTGTNIPNLHNLIFASPSKSRIRNLQSIGRGLRLHKTKNKVTLFDIADDLRYKKHENHTLKHFVSRTRLYVEEKFPFKVYKIDLK